MTITDNLQASLLYPFRDCRSTSHNQLFDCLYYVLGSVSFRRFGGSANASSSLGVNCYGTLHS